MMLSGNLSDWSVGDLLQMLHITKKTASLHIDGADRSGVVHFDEGSIVNADVSLGGGAKSDPRDEVVEAVYVLELLDDGVFEIKNEVPPRMIEPLAVAEALELAGQHLEAERHLDETGLLAARGLRLAQTIEEPIILSEQVWNAISVSIPAFTFPELEQRLGRAAAVATVEQFRDLGILEAVLEEVEQPPAIEHTSQIEEEPRDSFESSPEQTESQPADAVADAWIPPDSQHVDEPWIPPAGDLDDGSWLTPTLDADVGLVSDAGPADDLFPEPVEFVRDVAVETQQVVADAPEPPIVADEPVEQQEEDDAPVESVTSGLTPGASSLSAAIRAAASANPVGPSDDEAMLLSDAAEAEHPDSDEPAASEEGSLRRTVKSLVSPGSPGGGLGDLSTRIRQAASGDTED